MSIFSLIGILGTILGDLPKVMAAIQFLVKAITDAESTGKSGPDKLTLVLNDFEAFLGEVAPSWVGSFDTIAKDVESAVNDVVGLFNAFAHAAPAKAP